MQHAGKSKTLAESVCVYKERGGGEERVCCLTKGVSNTRIDRFLSKGKISGQRGGGGREGKGVVLFPKWRFVAREKLQQEKRIDQNLK